MRPVGIAADRGRHLGRYCYFNRSAFRPVGIQDVSQCCLYRYGVNACRMSTKCRARSSVRGRPRYTLSLGYTVLDCVKEDVEAAVGDGSMLNPMIRFTAFVRLRDNDQH